MESMRGHLLIASPRLLDPNFFHTVVLMVQHDGNGAMGLVLNRPTEILLPEAWGQISKVPCAREEKLYRGGPCQEILTALHTDATISDLEILPRVHFSADARNVERLMGQAETPARFFAGYAGWEASQLEAELESGSWLTVAATLEHIFGGCEDLWQSLRREIARATLLGAVNPKIIPTDATMN